MLHCWELTLAVPQCPVFSFCNAQILPLKHWNTSLFYSASLETLGNGKCECLRYTRLHSHLLLSCHSSKMNF